VVIAGEVFVYDELPKVASATELLVSRSEAPFARRAPRTARNGCVLMAHFEQDTDGMISISGRWWSFPGAQIETDSWEVECRGYGKLYLHDGAGNVVEGTEVEDPEVLAVVPLPSAAERKRRERLLARLLLLALEMLLSEAHINLGVKIETAKE
jgi:hypothetical protein